MAGKREQLTEAVAHLDREKVFSLSRELLQQNIPPLELFDLLRLGTEQVSNSYAAGEYFIADLIMADYIFKEVVKLAMGSEAEYVRPSLGSVLLGTVQGDIHELGKNLVDATLRYNGFTVEDLGTDLSPEKFVSAILTYAPDVLILSGTIAGSEIMMARTIEAIENAGLRHCVKIILGGSCISEKQAFAIGADGYSGYPVDCLRLCKQFLGGEV